MDGYRFEIAHDGTVIVIAAGGARCEYSPHGRADERMACAAMTQLIHSLENEIENCRELANLLAQERIPGDEP